MSWIERIKQDMIITTGDGKTYTPLYMISTKSVEYNLAEFLFPNVEGSLVQRGLPKGRRYPIEIVFQGDDHIEQSNAFEESAKDTRPWTISHPMYDTITVHPQSLTFDTSGLNTTKITGELIETITDDAPVITVDPTNQTVFSALETKELTTISFDNNVEPVASDVALMTQSTNDVYNLGAALVKSGEQANEYYNKYQETLNNVALATDDAFAAAQSMIDLFSFPSEFVDDLKRRFFIFQLQFEKIRDQLEDIFTPNEKAIYQMQGSAIITGMIESTVNPLDTDYQSVADVTFIIEELIKVNNTYIADLDSLQTDNGGDTDSYVPDYDAISSLTGLVNYTISELMNIALDSRQERRVVLNAESDIILLGHRFYGPTDDNSNVETFESTNNIGLNEILGIQAGKEVVYYV